MIIVNAKFEVQDDFIYEYEELVKDLVRDSKQESGNVAYSHFKSTEDENVYLMYEIWEDEQAIASHNNSEHFKYFSSQVKEILNGPLDIKVSQTV
ncbi:putative quinol monooxygenase [Mammaliicoccus stepanovicii]|uniref:Signal transduction protein TRAP n=1 Tax=Mammaliicoccus stepanovicii TaxID=643214 RepID=A0A239YDE9_9STAP|nr:putative quinol monooxygenase [Mammaliicoccus stepanovicii]PNZ75517.1 antibiotic biosynthesis monooxygenase [Mammaliicoccus stepanovicii]GGI42577.1 monooxygenase [Mammaliicoccus stepanovicii]SNV56443.1 monooxygenase family protein [Mammaliicoccus stepanovicii]